MPAISMPRIPNQDPTTLGFVVGQDRSTAAIVPSFADTPSNMIASVSCPLTPLVNYSVALPAAFGASCHVPSHNDFNFPTYQQQLHNTPQGVKSELLLTGRSISPLAFAIAIFSIGIVTEAYLFWIHFSVTGAGTITNAKGENRQVDGLRTYDYWLYWLGFVMQRKVAMIATLALFTIYSARMTGIFDEVGLIQYTIYGVVCQIAIMRVQYLCVFFIHCPAKETVGVHQHRLMVVGFNMLMVLGAYAHWLSLMILPSFNFMYASNTGLEATYGFWVSIVPFVFRLSMLVPVLGFSLLQILTIAVSYSYLFDEKYTLNKLWPSVATYYIDLSESIGHLYLYVSIFATLINAAN